MALSRYVPIGFDDDLWPTLATDLERMNQQMRRMNNQYSSLVPNQQPMDIGWNEAFRMDNPIVTDKDGNKKFHLEFDLRQFKPEEINLSTANNVLTVEAKHEEKSDGRLSYREYRRQYTIPEGVNVETLKSKLAHNGVLSIEAPVQKKQDMAIPIKHK
ncbi:heat shock protein Hsp-12.2-like [Liolophura sinensis]|uniref:heat shock protein Hsp-12.2-like n=1 Tax=Liolophura sinensis TaxID=3198878 RepID=UPI0031588CE5